MDFITNLLMSILSVLPDSPFQAVITALEDTSVLAVLNCVIPFGPIIGILQVWVVCMASYYVFKVIRDVIKTLISIL